MTEQRYIFFRIQDSCRGKLGLLFLLLSFLWLVSCEDLLTDPDGGDPRDRLVDTWTVNETQGQLKSVLEVYWVEISKHPFDSTRILIDNFYNVDDLAEAILTGNNLQLPEQVLKGGYTVSGTAVIQGSRANEITWSFTADDGSGEAVRLSAVYTRAGL